MGPTGPSISALQGCAWSSVDGPRVPDGGDTGHGSIASACGVMIRLEAHVRKGADVEPAFAARARSFRGARWFEALAALGVGRGLARGVGGACYAGGRESGIGCRSRSIARAVVGFGEG